MSDHEGMQWLLTHWKDVKNLVEMEAKRKEDEKNTCQFCGDISTENYMLTCTGDYYGSNHGFTICYSCEYKHPGNDRNSPCMSRIHCKEHTNE